MRIHLRFLSLSLLLVLSSCSRAPRSPERASGERVLEPAVRSLQAGGRIKESKQQPHFSFSWGERSFRVFHGIHFNPRTAKGWNEMYGWGPVLAVTEKGATRFLDLRAEFLSFYVAQVFHDSIGGRIFLFLDYGIEGPAGSYVVWISEDRGERWFRGADLLRPPGEFPPAELDSFFLNARGEGEAWFRIEAANLRPALRAPFAPHETVYFRAGTRDGGRSWSSGAEPELSSVLQQEIERHE